MELVAVQGQMSLIPGAAAAYAAARAEVAQKYKVALLLSSPAGAWRSEAMVLDMWLNPTKYGATKGVAKPKSLGGPGSVHENGRCIDVNNWATVGFKNLQPILAKHGFAHTIAKESWHFEYTGAAGGGSGTSGKPRKDTHMQLMLVKDDLHWTGIRPDGSWQIVGPYTSTDLRNGVLKSLGDPALPEYGVRLWTNTERDAYCLAWPKAATATSATGDAAVLAAIAKLPTAEQNGKAARDAIVKPA